MCFLSRAASCCCSFAACCFRKGISKSTLRTRIWPTSPRNTSAAIRRVSRAAKHLPYSQTGGSLYLSTQTVPLWRVCQEGEIRGLLSFSYARRILSHRPAVPVRLPKNVLSAVFAKVSRMDLTVVYPGGSPCGTDNSVGRSFAASPAFALMACSFLCQSLDSFCLLVCR